MDKVIHTIPGISNADSGMFFLLAGPCVVENEKLVLEIASGIQRITDRLKIPYVFKASYRKANRSRMDSFTGIGDQEALRILEKVKEETGLPVVTDFHNAGEAAMAAQVADILQIPAFLCRQTDMLIAAAETGKVVNIKKGQFLAPGSMRHAVRKVLDAGNDRIMLTDRGTMFGYQDLIVDIRSVPIMQETGFPVVMDITHSLQQPNQEQGVSGGQPALIETLGRAAIAAGADGIFLETHPEPAKALSDGANMLPLGQLEKLLEKLVKIRSVIIDS
jgi:2-dehydro-3-deoxyphosphooctonate aldolase (KDO 8-P synthase)